MKNFTLLLIALCMATFGVAQTISFENGEGYSLGNINGQNSWTSSLGGGVTPVTNQIVTTERASAGSNSLKLVNESAFPTQMEANTGAFYAYASPIDVTSTTISFDVYIDASGLIQDDISDHVMAFRNGNTNITYVIFSFNGGIGLLTNTQADGNGTIDFEFASQSWTTNTWYNIQVDINNPNVELFIDGSSTAAVSSFVATPNLNITETAFVHTNYESSFFIDNFDTSDEVLSVDDNLVVNEDYRYLSNSQELLLKNSNQSLENISVFNLLGQQVFAKQLSGNEERLNVQNLSNGIYVAQITVGGNVQTLKFSKH